MNAALDDFVACLRRSELLDKPQLDAALVDFPASLPTNDDCVIELGRLLIARGLLTPWQVDMLQRKMFKGFLLDDYLLLDCLGREYDFTRYHARHLPTTRIVVLRIYRPWNEAEQRPGIRYELENES